MHAFLSKKIGGIVSPIKQLVLREIRRHPIRILILLALIVVPTLIVGVISLKGTSAEDPTLKVLIKDLSLFIDGKTDYRLDEKPVFIITVPTQEKRPVPFPESGLARHNSTVNTFIGGKSTTNDSANTNSAGDWSLKVGIVLHLGTHTVFGLVNDGFGNQSILTTPTNFEILLSADLSIDNLVNLTDFSILMFNYGTSNPPNAVADINDNGPVDLVDFSVMMFY